MAKPSEFTPTTAYLLAEAANRAGVPPGVLNIIHGRGQDVGAELVGNRGKEVFFKLLLPLVTLLKHIRVHLFCQTFVMCLMMWQM